MKKFILLFMFLTISGRARHDVCIDDIMGYEVTFESLNSQTADHTIYIDEETRKLLTNAIKKNDTYFVLPYEIINMSAFHIIKITKL